MISIIAALSDNYVIGDKGKLPWDIPADTQHFAKTTKGSTIVMGRKTCESIGSPLIGRESVVLTRNPKWAYQGVHVVHDVKSVMKYANKHSEMFVIGGEEIYREMFDFTTKLYLTFVHARFKGDTFFPRFSLKHWSLDKDDFCPADNGEQYDISFQVYNKID